MRLCLTILTRAAAPWWQVITQLFKFNFQPISQEWVTQPELCRLLLDGRGQALQHTSQATANGKSHRPLQIKKPRPVI